MHLEVLVLITLLVGGSRGFVVPERSQQSASRLQSAADDVLALGVPAALLGAGGVLGVRLTNYFKLQFASARLISGIPPGSVVAEINAVDGMARLATGPA